VNTLYKKLLLLLIFLQGNSVLERSHRTLKEIVASELDSNPNVKFEHACCIAQMIHNSMIHAGTKMSPMDMLLGVEDPEPKLRDLNMSVFEFYGSKIDKWNSYRNAKRRYLQSLVNQNSPN